MNEELLIFISSNYTSEKAILMQEAIEALNRISEPDDQALLSITRTNNDIILASVSDVFEGCVVDLLLTCLRDTFIYVQTRDLALLSDLAKFLLAIHNAPDFASDIAILTPDDDTPEDRFIDLVASYQDVDRYALAEAIERVNLGFLENLLERAVALQGSVAISVDVHRYRDRDLVAMRSALGPDAGLVMELMVDNVDVSKRVDALLAFGVDELLASTATQQTRRLLAIWLGSSLVTTAAKDLDPTAFEAWCRRWWASQSLPDTALRSAAKTEFAKFMEHHNGL